MAAIEIRGLEKWFGPVKVLQGIDIQIGDGEFVVLVGPSGCGKSTLLRTVAGLEALSTGSILIDGREVNDLPAKDRDIAMVFQSYALYPHMTVAENMGFSLRLRHMDKKLVRERVGRAAEILNLSELLARKPSQLSGGQRQRVAMGRAIVRDPKVFLFDEPLSNLDAKLRVAMRSEIKALHQRLKTTVVYVTHDQVEAMTMADRIVVLNQGRIEQTGTPLELYDRPVNLFVAEFIGSPAMNLLPGTVKAAGGQRVVEVENGGKVALPGDAAVADGQPVMMGVRPEHLGLASNGGGLRGEVELVEPTGAQVHIVARIAGQEVVAVFNDRVIPALGSAMMLMPQPGTIHLFDRSSGRRLATA
jgi:multiple sugar transport system ATP-binding protein